MSGIEFATGAPAKVRRAPGARLRRRAVVLGVVASIVTAALLLVVDAALSARGMLHDLSAARNSLIEGGNSLVTGDPEVAARSFTTAGNEAEAAVGASERPGVRLLGILPFIGGNVTAARAVARSQADTAAAGLTMVEAARALQWHDILLPSTEAIGGANLRALTKAAPSVALAATQLQAALHRLELAGGARLLGPVAAGYDDAVTGLTRQAALAADARNLLNVAPELLGARGTRRYLVAVSSLAQPLGPGGRLGPVGILTAKAGTLTMEPLAPGAAAIGDAATSPDVPTAAEAMLAAAAGAGQDALNGLILVDTQGLADLLWMVGDVETPDWPSALSQDDIVEIMDGEVLQGSDAAAADAQQAALATAVLNEVLARRPSVEAFGTAMAQVVAGRHLAVYSRDKAVQALLTRLGATGHLVTVGNPLAVVWNTTGDARTGALIRRSTAVSVNLDAQGLARVRTVVDLKNEAPNGPPSVQLGRAFGPEPVGGYAADVNVYLPAAAERVTVETSTPTVSDVSKDEDLGLTVATAPLRSPPGGSMSMIVAAEVPGAVTRDGGVFEYRIRIAPQPSVVPDALRVQIKVPNGMTIRGASEGLLVGGTTAKLAGTPDGTLVLYVRYA